MSLPVRRISLLKACVNPVDKNKFHVKIGIVLFLILSTLAVYAQVVTHEFIYFDDPEYLVNNTNIHYGINFHSIFWAFTTFHASNWHPLTWLSHLLDVQMFGLNPAGHLATNVVLHTANTVLLFLFLSRASGAIWRSAMVAVLFALHPLHVESVAWASERKDVLSAFFWMSTLYLYTRYAEQPGRIRYIMTVISMALGLMAKPMLVTLPIIMLLLDYWPLGRFASVPGGVGSTRQHMWKLALEKVPFAALSALSCVVTLYAQSGAITPLKSAPILARIANAFVSYVLYIYKMVLPLNLSVLYQFNNNLPAWQTLGAVGTLTAASVVVYRQRLKRPYLMAGWLWYICSLVPVIGIVKVGSQGMADRYSYIPLIGLFVMVVWGVADRSRKWAKGAVVCSTMAAVVSLTCAAAAWRQVTYWSDTTTLFTHVLATDKNNFMAYFCLGVELEKAGKLAEATAYYQKTISIAPWYSNPYCQLGNIYAREGKFAQALEMYDKAVAMEPDSFDSHTNRALFLSNQNRMDEAVEGYYRALTINPKSAVAYNNLGFAFQKLKRLDDAVTQYTNGLKIEPRSAMIHANLGTVFALQKKYDEAIRHYTAALESDPESYSTHHNLAVIYQALKRNDEAVTHYRKALRLNSSLPETHNNLGVALGEQGNRDAAIQHFNQALTLRPDYVEARRNLDFAVSGKSR